MSGAESYCPKEKSISKINRILRRKLFAVFCKPSGMGKKDLMFQYYFANGRQICLLQNPR